MEFNHGVLFSDTYQKKLKSQFYYADKDPQYGARLFFENSGGSLRLKKAVEAKAFWCEEWCTDYGADCFPDYVPCSWHDHGRC